MRQTAKIHFDAPPAKIEAGTLHAFLYKLSQDLNQALVTLDGSNFVPEVTQAISAAQDTEKVAEKAAEDKATQLRTLIVKTAKEVEAEMDALEVTLNSRYIAKSEWGTYEENIESQITATASSVIQSYDFQSQITTLAEGVAEFNSYRTETAGYIKQGIVRYDGTTPVIGIAIGQNITTSGTETVDGVTYDVIEAGQNIGVYTASGLSFWQGGSEVAYLKDRKLYITSAKVTGNIEVGKWVWIPDGTKGLTLKWNG